MSVSRLESAVPAGVGLLLDTSIVLAYLGSGELASAVAAQVMDGFLGSERNPGTISTVTVTEALVRAHRRGVADGVWPMLLDLPALEIRSVDFLVAAEAARMRAVSRLATPHALILATGVMASCEVLVTNDQAFAKAARVLVPEIAVCLLSDYV